jgi:hypothetical protein
MTVHYIQPFAIDKNICKAYNEACDLIPFEDWICITDMDTMFLHPEQKRIIDRVAKSGQADLYGCVTNRCNVPDLVLPSMFDERDIKKHYLKAESRLQQYDDIVQPYNGVVPGYLMLFSKKTWYDVGGFSLGEYGVNYAFDQYFSAKIKRKAIIKGVYLLHLYRIWSDMPAWDVDHLK